MFGSDVVARELLSPLLLDRDLFLLQTVADLHDLHVLNTCGIREQFGPECGGSIKFFAFVRE